MKIFDVTLQNIQTGKQEIVREGGSDVEDMLALLDMKYGSGYMIVKVKPLLNDESVELSENAE